MARKSVVIGPGIVIPLLDLEGEVKGAFLFDLGGLGGHAPTGIGRYAHTYSHNLCGLASIVITRCSWPSSRACVKRGDLADIGRTRTTLISASRHRRRSTSARPPLNLLSCVRA